MGAEACPEAWIGKWLRVGSLRRQRWWASHRNHTVVTPLHHRYTTAFTPNAQGSRLGVGATRRRGGVVPWL